MTNHPHAKEIFDQMREAGLDIVSNVDDVAQPTHYKGKTLEVIHIIEDFGLNFNLGNVLKYVLRAGKKEDRIKDLKKALWYLEREIGNE